MRISDWSSDVCSSDLVVEIGAGSLRDAHGDVKTPVALVHKPRFTPAEPCRNRIRNVADGETEARDRGAVEFHIERWRATDLFRSEEHTSELQSLMRISYAVFCLKKNKQTLRGLPVVIMVLARHAPH